ncbi:MAG: bifunctional phosphopantothenoylcysteine decarboxylase/phosphopantothenate--cysteine ligase CoaBC [Chloroflexota bacterium]|nr:bifunctional phosphopantothenoylcysteine decarboxylase/phosphopantothenate--cysteine ligase CoaBC [Chloroflexota bacterium]
MVKNKTIVLAVTGSIAVYKATDLASKLTQDGAKVIVVMTKAAQEFVNPMTFQRVTDQPTITDMFGRATESENWHISLAEQADIVVIAPATANTIAKLAAGIADDILGCTVLATKAPILISPAMHTNMYENTITQENINKLKARRMMFVGPAEGRLASGGWGRGRFVEIDEIRGTIHQLLGRFGDLSKVKILVSAGGTQEPLDPVRHISNRSSGKMGFAIAEAARDRGAEVALVSAPTTLVPPVGVRLIRVQTAIQMRDACILADADADVVIMAAAPADYRPKLKSPGKIKKGTETLNLELAENPDIFAELKGNSIRVGFAAESENLVKNAKEKLERKNLDLIVANDITRPGSGFDADDNRVVLIDCAGKVAKLPLLPKQEVADKILDRVAALLDAKNKAKSNISTKKKTK